MEYYLVEISFDNLDKPLKKYYKANDTFDAIDLALAEYPEANGAGVAPSNQIGYNGPLDRNSEWE